MSAGTPVSEWLPPVAVLLVVVVLAYLGMWRGWKRRAGKHDLPPLVALPAASDLPPAELQADARYFGTTVSGDWLDRVVARGLGARSTARLSLSAEGLDVVRQPGGFRIPAESLRAARHDQGIAGKVVPPHGVLVVTWQHGDLLLDTGFRLQPPPSSPEHGAADGRRSTGTTATHDEWIRAIGRLAEDHEEHTA